MLANLAREYPLRQAPPGFVRFHSVQRPAGKLAGALMGICVCAAMFASPSSAQIPFGPCPETNDFACGRLTVALDHSGQTPGTLTLAIRRHRAPVGESKVAVIALAGGPGQPADPFATDFAELLGPIISTRDLIVFDQRGTGDSHPLKCRAFSESSAHETAGHALTRCANEIGGARRFFTTAQSVADIEAIRVAGGYEKVVLYGTSYGTKVAERYAQEYPGQVQALILDSVVPPNGPDQLAHTTFASVPRVLSQLCGFHQCAGITHNLTREVAQLVRRMGSRGLHARIVNGEGHPHTILINSDELLEILIAGDLQPTLRSEFPAAVHSALHGDTALLGRMLRNQTPNPKNPPNRSTCPSTMRRPAKRSPSPGCATRAQSSVCAKPARESTRSLRPRFRLLRTPTRSMSATSRNAPTGRSPASLPKPTMLRCRPCQP